MSPKTHPIYSKALPKQLIYRQKGKSLLKQINKHIANGRRDKAFVLAGKHLPKLYQTALLLASFSSNDRPLSGLSRMQGAGTRLLIMALLLFQRISLLIQERSKLNLLTDLALVRAEIQIGLLDFDLACTEARIALDYLSFYRPFIFLSRFIMNRSHPIQRRIDRFSKVIVRAMNSRQLISSHNSGTRINEDNASNYDCDIIAIASDEGPYIAEFIHHYLYLGFNHIFIGINNSSDETEAILSAITSGNNHTHVIETDEEHSLFGQKSSYTRLYQEARRISASRYVLFVDVDEFWVSRPFPLKIYDFIKRFDQFDSLGCHWVNLHEKKEFSPPLSSTDEAYLLGHFKSLVAYSDNLLELRCHAPLLQSSATGYRAIDSSGTRLNPLHLPIGIEVPKGQAPSHSSLLKQSAFILHRANRSMIEYCFRLLKPHANQRKQHQQEGSDCPFKTNRNGFDYRTGIRADSRFLDELLPAEDIANYHLSLKLFCKDLDLSKELSLSMSKVTRTSVERRLRGIEHGTLARYRDVWSITFRGTPFLEMLNQLADHGSSLR